METNKERTPLQEATVTCTRDPEAAVTKTGRTFLKTNLAAETDSGETVFLSGLFFDEFAVVMSHALKKGTRARMKGRIEQKEYTKKDGTAGVENVFWVQKVKVRYAGKVIIVDEFTSLSELPSAPPVAPQQPSAEEQPSEPKGDIPF